MTTGYDLIPVAIEVHDILKKRGVYDRVLDWWNSNATCNVLVLGATGTGKTSLAKALSGLPPHVPRVAGRSDETEISEGKIRTTPFRFMVTPGESHHEAKRKESILKTMSYDRPGVINVVSYGFHEPDIKVSEAVKDGIIRNDYLRRRRDLEIELVSEWNEKLFGPGAACRWIITVVTKSDMWWQRQDKQPVVDYYRTGAYYESLGQAKSTEHTTHSVRPYSALDQPLFGEVAMSGFYSDQLRNQHHNELVSLLLDRASK